MYYTWAWHETILLYSKSSWTVENIKSWWIALKMVQEIGYLIEEKELIFEKWDVIILYSDRITEWKNQFWEMYWLKKLINVLETYWSWDIENIFDWFTSDYSEFVWSHPQEDDLTIFILKNTGHHWKEPKIDIWIKQSNVNWITRMQWSWE